MAKQQPMWLARDNIIDNLRGFYHVFYKEPEPTFGGGWEAGVSDGEQIDPAQSPVELEPGQGPVKVRLVEA